MGLIPKEPPSAEELAARGIGGEKTPEVKKADTVATKVKKAVARKKKD